MTKNKLVALGLTLLATVIGVAVQSGVLPNVCPPPPVCTSVQLDAGAQ